MNLSDKDLFETGLEKQQLNQIKNQLAESDLSIKVDIVNLSTCSEDFSSRIRAEMIKL